jgi:hypothetical protein
MMDVDGEARAFLGVMWQHIARFVRENVFPHGAMHLPNGRDPLHLHVEDLTNVNITGVPNAGKVLTADGSGGWVDGTGGGGGGSHEAHFSLGLPAVVVPPGPCNITGKTLYIKNVRFKSDGECAGDFGVGNSFSFSAGGGTSRIDMSSSPGTWTDGTELTLSSFTQGDDGSYLSCDFYCEETS